MARPAHALHPLVDRAELLVRDRPPPRHAPGTPSDQSPARRRETAASACRRRGPPGGPPRCRPYAAMPCPAPARAAPISRAFLLWPRGVCGRVLPDAPDRAPSRNGHAAEQALLAAQPVGPAPDGSADGMPRPPAGAVAVPGQALAGNAGAGSALFQLVRPLRYAVGPARHAFPARPVDRRRLRLFVRPAHEYTLGLVPDAPCPIPQSRSRSAARHCRPTPSPVSPMRLSRVSLLVLGGRPAGPGRAAQAVDPAPLEAIGLPNAVGGGGGGGGGAAGPSTGAGMRVAGPGVGGGGERRGKSSAS